MKRKNLTFKNNQIGIACCQVELKGSAPTELRLTPAGLFKAKDGRPEGLAGWIMNDSTAADVIAAASALQDQLLIDYEHQTLHSTENGKPAPAAAWFSKLEWRSGDGLYATDVQWTAAAKAAIEAKEYRYISPVMAYNKKTGEVGAIVMASLVNYPAIDGLTDLAAAHFNFNQQGLAAMAGKLGDLLSRLMKEKSVTAEQLGTAAGIEAGTVQQILDGSISRPPDERLKGFAKALGVSLETIMQTLPEEEEKEIMNEALRALLGVAKDASDEEITAATVALKAKLDQAEQSNQEVEALKAKTTPDPNKFVPMEQFVQMQNEVASLSGRLNTGESESLITAALKDGRLLKGQEDWAKTLTVEGLKSYLAAAQPVAALKGTQTDGKEPEGQLENGLTVDEMAVCKATGIDVEEFKKTKV